MENNDEENNIVIFVIMDPIFMYKKPRRDQEYPCLNFNP